MIGTINSGGAKPQDLSGYLKTEQLGKAGGIAPLDEQAKIILDYLYTNAANALAKLDANGKLPTDLIPALSAYIAATAKGAANGVATLDASGKLPSGQLTSHAHAYSSLTGVPSTFPPASHSHAASEISGLAAAIAGLGYSKTVCMEYAGSGVGVGSFSTGSFSNFQNPRAISIGFSPKLVILAHNSYTNLTAIAQGKYATVYDVSHTTGNTQTCKIAYLDGETLYVTYAYPYGTETRSNESFNHTGATYTLIAVA